MRSCPRKLGVKASKEAISKEAISKGATEKNILCYVTSLLSATCRQINRDTVAVATETGKVDDGCGFHQD